MKTSYKVGEQCWIFCGELTESGTPKLSPGVVVGIVNYDYLLYPWYVIKLDDMDFLHGEVRDAYLMSPSKDVLPQFARFAMPSIQELKIHQKLEENPE